jgi:iron(III) transport system substrate-binding protein
MRHLGPRPRRWRLLVGVTVGALLLFSCGDAGEVAGTTAPGLGTEAPSDTPTETQPPADGQLAVADVLAEVDGLGPDERRARLVELAASEDGQVTLYTSLASDNLDALAEEFQADTGIIMLTYRAAAEDVRTRVLQESQANRIGADLVAIGDSRLIPIAEQGILAPYTSPYQEALIEGSVAEFWTAMRFNLYAVAWNTSMVAEGEQPTSFEDLADPRWAGIMTLEPSDYDWYWSVSNYLVDDVGYTEEEVDAFWRTVADNAAFSSGHTSTRQLLIAGEYAVFASDFSYGIEGAKADGAPVEWQPPVEPLFATPEAAAIVAATPRPASSVLTMDWLISDGLAVLDEQAIDVTREDLLDIAGFDIRFVDAEEWVLVESDVMEEYDALSGAGG